MRRGGCVLKLTILTIAVVQALAFTFESLLVMAGFAPDAATVLLFRFVTCALVSFWVQRTRCAPINTRRNTGSSPFPARTAIRPTSRRNARNAGSSC